MKILANTTVLLGISLLLSLNIFAQAFDGYAMYTEDNFAYLIDKDGDVAYRWNCPTRAGYAMFMKDNGNIVRAAVNNGNAINGAAVAGLVQELDANGDVVWEFEYSSNEYVSHHDITAMPNGGVLLTAWEVPGLPALQELGYEGDRSKYPTHFIEVQQDGTGGKIVWEWHIQDHFVQNVDDSKPNFGAIEDNPQLMDINVAVASGPGGGPGGGGPGGGGGGDWFHVNGVHYDADMDQIVFSSRFLSEIFIIDHSTTTEEAAGHTGGNSGKGGDFLWRWGKPANYNTPGTENITGPVHDSRIVPNDGRLFSDYVQILNNAGVNGATQVDNILLPRDGFNFIKEDGAAYGPEVASAIHEALDESDGQSSSYRLPNGNLYVNLSRSYQYEVDPDDNVVWQYADAAPKGFRVTCSHPGVQQLIADGVLDGSDCQSLDTEDLIVNPYTVSPNPSTGIFTLDNVIAENKITSIEVTSPSGQLIETFSKSSRTIDLSSQSPAVYFLVVNYSDRKPATKRIVLSK